MHKIPILTYHSISNRITSRYNILPGEFARQMRCLRESGYNTLALDELEKSRPNSSKSFFILTFDDGHKSNFDTVMPILKEYGFNAIFFISTGLIGNDDDFMSWQETRELRNSGHSIQSHGHSHRFLNQISDNEVVFELRQSMTIIGENIGILPDTFSCPGGRYNRGVIEIAKSIGYKRMFTSAPRNFNPGKDSNNFALGRFMITRDITINKFKRLLEEDKLFLSMLSLKHDLKHLLKIGLGDGLYHSITKNVRNK